MFFETFLADDVRYAYAKSPLLAKLFAERATIDAVSQALEVPIAKAHKGKLTDGDAKAALEQHVNHLRSMKASPWHGLSAADVAAAGLVKSTLPVATKDRAFSSTKREADLTAPVAKLMSGYGFTVFDEVSTGRCRADLLGWKDGIFSPTVIVLELKNTVKDFERGMNQVATYAGYAHEVWVACTPWAAAKCLDEHSRGKAVHAWDPMWLKNKLEGVGCGLVLVEFGQAVIVQRPRKNDVDSKRVAETRSALVGRKALV